VDARRHGADYDPELALVAEVEGEVAGHGFFYPFRVLVGGQELRAVALGPIAVDPRYQRQGIGAALMGEGHRRAARKGYVFSFLLGHPSYYPRFGYVPKMFGECRLEVRASDILTAESSLEGRLVQPEDTEALVAMWKTWFEDVDLAVVPGRTVLDWAAHADKMMSYVVVNTGQLVGYVRYAKKNPAEVKMLLARDRASMWLLLGHLKEKMDTPQAMISLPLHPEARVVREWVDVAYEVVMRAWDAAMIKVLDQGSRAIVEYCEQVGRGERSPGLVIYPPAYDVA
jgi:putative acetyltransferase